jgi:hypothetical protein
MSSWDGINIRASLKTPNSRLAKFGKPEFTDSK